MSAHDFVARRRLAARSPRASSRRTGETRRLLADCGLCIPGGRQLRILWMISVFRRYFVASEAGVERGNFFLCLDQRPAGGDILAGKDRLSSGNVGLAANADAEKQVERYQRRLRRRRYPHAMAKDYGEAVHRSLSCGYIGLQLRTNTVNAGKVLYGQLSFFSRQPYDF